jgi:hypothetical protein
MSTISVVAGWSVLVVIDLLALMVLYRMALGQINLSRLLSEPTGDASLSRFQLLVFTYVVGLSLFLVTVYRDVPLLPEIPGGILALLGISASTYAVSKGIQFSTPKGLEERTTEVTVTPNAVSPSGSGSKDG